jgi:hypothetical protein
VAIEKDVVILLGGIHDSRRPIGKRKAHAADIVGDTDFSPKKSYKTLGTWARHLSHIWCSDYSVWGGGGCHSGEGIRGQYRL